MNHRSVLKPLLFSLLCFLMAAASTVPLDRHYRQDRLALPVSAAAGVPADVLLLQQSLGAFRGWAINALWLKALERRDQGELHESLELARWILKLQPYFPRVWNFQSWLLAFELALDTRDPQERWNWVSESIRLLRTEGLRSNPLSDEIHRQLSYLFWFKLGESRDDAAPYFRRELFRQWQGILGAAANQSEVQQDLLRSLDPEKRSFIVEDLNMDPQLMLDISDRFPGLDWRVPASHAIYWAIQGFLRQETGEISPRLTDDLFASALFSSHVRIGLQQLIVHGRPIVSESTGELIANGPVPELLPVFLRSLQALGGGEIPDEFRDRAREIVTDTALQAWLLGEDDLSVEILNRLELFGIEPLKDPTNLVSHLAEVVRGKLDPDEPVTMISIPIMARGLIALSGGGLQIEYTRGSQIVEILESDLEETEIQRSRAVSIAEALRSPRASAPLSVKQQIWQNLPEAFRQGLDAGTLSVLRDDARKSGADPKQAFPGLESSIGKDR
ncbi:MAG: hypothetical protein H2076_05580 [Planctomycetes bacterium]|nr:hypothetical protein [Planctomycetota bacterium]